MKKLFLSRHGETIFNVKNIRTGSQDVELTNRGLQQARELGKNFPM